MELLFTDVNLKTGEKRKYILDDFNSKKIWIVSYSKCRHYKLTQTINGRIVGHTKRVGKKYIESIIGKI
jgi:hypothetical protein